MASEAILEKKKSQVVVLSEKLQNSVTGILVDYKGISVEDDTKLRSELRAAGVDYTVVKNSILSRACEKVGFSDLDEVLVGTTALAVSDSDVVAPAKILAKYAKQLTDKFVIKGGFLEGEVVSLAQINELATLPTREELIAKMLGSMNAPISGLVRVLNGNISGLAQVLRQVVEQKSA